MAWEAGTVGDSAPTPVSGSVGAAAKIDGVEWSPVGNIRGPAGPEGPPGPAGTLVDANDIPELAIVADLDDIRDLTLLIENGMI